MTLGKRILELRAHAGLSQEDFGEMFGATRQTVSRWELDLAIPEIQKIVQMARTFGVTTDSIIADGISTFDSAYQRFVCGVYRKKDTVIVETERLALCYYDRGDVLCSELYEGIQENKTLRGTVEFNIGGKSAKYAYSDDGGKITANFDASDVIGRKFDRTQLDGMKRVETFLVSRDKKPQPTVSEAGFKTCLTSWREGTRFYCRDGQIFALVYLHGMEYFFHMVPWNHENIYCGMIANEAFELGSCIGKQHFRIRNFNGNPSNRSFSLINDPFERVSLPTGENGVDFGENCAGPERILRYGDDWITVSNCGDELTYFRNDADMIEKFEY